MRCARIHLTPTIDNQEAPPILVDAVLDEKNAIFGLHTLFGLQGSFETRDTAYYPFTLDKDGQIDFGMGYDGEHDAAGERHAQFDLRNDMIFEGRLVALRSSNYGEQRYRIFRIIELGHAAPQ